MDDLIAFICARLDEDEAAAKDKRYIWPTEFEIALNPARVLREVAAKRAIVTRYETACRQADIAAVNGGSAEQEAWEKIAGALELDVRNLAAVYSDEWKP